MAEAIVSPGVFQRETDQSFITPTPVEVGATIIGPTVKGPVEQPTVVSSFADYKNKFGTTFTSASEDLEFFTSIAAQKFFANGGNSMLITRVSSGSYTSATSTTLTSSHPTLTTISPFTLKTIGAGEIFNNAVNKNASSINQFSDSSLSTGSKDNLRWEVTGINTSAGTFNLTIRRGDDNKNNKIILETFVGCSLDPKSENYIKRVVGDQFLSQATYEGQTVIRTNGDYPNQSKLIFVDSVGLKTSEYLRIDGSVGTDDGGALYSASLPLAQSGSFFGADGKEPGNANYPLPPTTFDKISSTNTQGLLSSNYTKAFNILENKDEYRFATLTTPGAYNSDYASVVASGIALCEKRGDCFYIADMVAYNKTVANVTSEAGELNTNFAGTYWPWVQVPSTELSRNVWCPASTVMQGVYAANDKIAAPWFAPAGLNRGGLPIIRTEFKVTQALRDTLYDNKVNPLATFPKVGPVAYGQKTLQKKASALDRINVRRLLISLKNFIGDTSKQLVFEQNTTVTRNRFLNAVNPFLESVQQRQGLFAFRVVMDESNNTADAIDRNQLVGQIFIQPTRTAEFIILDYTIQPTGATFND